MKEEKCRDSFGVSIKGILEIDGKLLLRKNERKEYEFLGGRLEKSDISAQERLITEFKEESGIHIEVLSQMEPWLYEIGLKNIIIIPYRCTAIHIPDILLDEDGGTLHWISQKDIDHIFMPQGYKDTVSGGIPHKSYSLPPKSFFKTVSNYIKQDYYIEISVREHGIEQLYLPLPLFHSPRDFIFSQLGETYKNARLMVQPLTIIQERDTVILNYELLR